jgi:hypothetical protein
MLKLAGLMIVKKLLYYKFKAMPQILMVGLVYDATSNNISVILWQSVLLVEETGVPRENHPPVAKH